jgi:hypothetical protein
MKKIILGLSFLAIAATTTFVACKKDEKSVQTTQKKTALTTARVTTRLITPAEMDLILALSSDSVFQALVRLRVAEFNNAILNGSAITNIANLETVTPATVSTYSSLIGYTSAEELIQKSAICKSLEATLETNYQFSTIDKDLVVEAFALTGSEIDLPAGMSPSACLTIYNNTCAQILAESIGMHCGCAAIDAIGLGLVCHAAVLAWGVASTNIAKANYDSCH